MKVREPAKPGELVHPSLHWSHPTFLQSKDRSDDLDQDLYISEWQLDALILENRFKFFKKIRKPQICKHSLK